MATLTATSTGGTGARVATENTLTASDTFTYISGGGQVLVLRNGTAGALTVNIDGAGGATVPLPGVGNVDVSAGYSTASIGIGAVVAIPLDSISAYCQGVIAMTGGDGISAILLN